MIKKVAIREVMERNWYAYFLGEASKHSFFYVILPIKVEASRSILYRFFQNNFYLKKKNKIQSMLPSIKKIRKKGHQKYAI